MTTYRLRPVTPLQELVLRAALVPGAEAVEAWASVVEGDPELNHLDQGSFRLLPLVSRNLSALGIDFPASAQLKGIYRQAWYRNNVAVAAVSPLLSNFAEAGIPAMLLKGLAAVHLAYGELGARPMNDADVLVRPGNFRRSRDLALKAGFKPASGVAEGEAFRTFHAVAFRDARGLDIDIHHHMLEEACWPGADDGVWARATPAEFAGTPVAVPSPADLLINLCVHGTRWDPVPSVRWIADSALLIRNQPIDWDVLVGEAQRKQVTLAMAGALSELSRFAPVPQATIEALQMFRPRWIERADFRAQQGGTSAPGMVARYVTRYGRLSSRRSLRRRAVEFPTYLQGMWELDSRRAVFTEGPRRFVLRLRGKQPRRGNQSAPGEPAE